MKQLLITIISLLSLSSAWANTPTIVGRLDRDSVYIGDQFDIIVEVDMDVMQTIIFPEFENTKQGAEVEAIKSHPVDTIHRDGRQIKLQKRYTLAAFQEGMFNLGTSHVLYLDKNIVDTLHTKDSLILEVATFQIDSTSQSIYDVKPQMGMPFKFAEISGYLLWVIIALVVVGGALYALVRILKKRGKSIGDIFRGPPPLPPHVAAIKALEAIHHQKLWQNERYKEYYSSIADILRTYIEARFGIDAMEMTSEETIKVMKSLDIPQKSLIDLTSILHDADLAKFAKATPDAEQNENTYHKAYYFVEETKPVTEIGSDEHKQRKEGYKIQND